MEDIYIERQDEQFTIISFVTESLMNPQEIERISLNLYNKVDVEKRKQLVLDFVRVRYLSSSAIGMLVNLNKKLKAAGGKLILVGVGAELLQLFKIANLHKVLTINP